MDNKTNKKKPDMNKTAVALQYDPEDNAPRVIASGKGYLADKIIGTAKEEKIPIHQDEKLSKSLSTLSIGDMIPPELYEVVAEILTFVDDMDRLKRKLDLEQ
ncbi:flagellar biosynthesis protein [Lachnotalea glycerini]|jgi:flagellar biosynthesis protein|uniref:Flagellar biosynthesis protein n=1 Tax=Lachnotalea glycerini TaxID=1763509 RepID=A0A255LHK5_9FIRM|nr:EscU/YscU/HrcU family type III secretion system export apparatus switch protein [Lachnotalea glycerini]OYO76208.1 flagellar biosynthesis protein FlhB [Lachnotalea glycerini]PXV96089.1 flagellar biosynthesis protein [Lachnotalea glycerini]RDY29080.1 flagellar biosynthesis protein FlhB [Lachnotalea glycerini]